MAICVQGIDAYGGAMLVAVISSGSDLLLTRRNNALRSVAFPDSRPRLCCLRSSLHDSAFDNNDNNNSFGDGVRYDQRSRSCSAANEVADDRSTGHQLVDNGGGL